LDDYEKSLYVGNLKKKIEGLENSLGSSRETAEEKREMLVRLISARKDLADDPVSQLDIAEARMDWESAFRLSLDDREGLKKAQDELSQPPRWIRTHTDPTIRDKPVGKASGQTLPGVLLSALGSGLAFSQAVPYLMELAFPRGLRRKPMGNKEAWLDREVLAYPGRAGL